MYSFLISIFLANSAISYVLSTNSSYTSGVNLFALVSGLTTFTLTFFAVSNPLLYDSSAVDVGLPVYVYLPSLYANP